MISTRIKGNLDLHVRTFARAVERLRDRPPKRKRRGTTALAAQGVTPRDMHLVLGDGSWETLRLSDVAYYWRRAQARFKADLADPLANSQPEPVPACPLCPWREPKTLNYRAFAI